MFDWLGTFNRSQFDRLAAYARGQLVYIDARIQHLGIEQQRIGFLQFAYDTAGRPTSYTTGTPGFITVIGKLMSTYEVLGGDPFYNLQMRTVSQPVTYLKGSETSTAKILSNGEPVPQLGLSDGPSGNAVRQIRSWSAGNLDRLERLERKIRRMVDYSDQLGTEIAALKKSRQTVDTDGSLENLISFVTQLFSDPTYRAIADDNGADPFGKLIYAPMSSYDQGGTRREPDGLTVERGGEGYTTGGGSSA
jgi:hypothetical protein